MRLSVGVEGPVWWRCEGLGRCAEAALPGRPELLVLLYKARLMPNLTCGTMENFYAQLKMWTKNPSFEITFRGAS